MTTSKIIQVDLSQMDNVSITVEVLSPEKRLPLVQSFPGRNAPQTELLQWHIDVLAECTVLTESEVAAFPYTDVLTISKEAIPIALAVDPPVKSVSSDWTVITHG